MSITNEEIDNAINNIETYEFKTLFKKDNHKSWLNSILKVKNRHKAYPMFWLLNDEKKSYKLSKQLKILKTNCKKYNSIIKKLIKDDFDSALTEIEVISYFYENFDSNSIEYEPKTGNGNKKADLKLTYCENDYYFEIALLKDDKETKNMENLWNKIQKRLREQNCCYDMICEVEPCVNGVNGKEEDIDQFIDGFINFIQENFKKIDKSFLYVNNGFKADITFSEDGLGPIQFSGLRAPNIPRMKKKLLDKLEKGQLPINNSNIIVIKLNDDFISLNAAFEAIYGQNKHNIINNDIMNVSDGFINKTGSDNISAIIIYKQDFTNRALYLNPNAKKIISNDMIKKLRVKNRKE